MKKAGIAFILIILLFSLFSLAYAQDDTGTGIGEEDAEKIQGALEKIPIDESGNIDQEKLNINKTKVEDRIETVNVVLKPITKFVWGIELGLSGKFAVVFSLWIFLIAVLALFITNILGIRMLISFPAGILAASLIFNIFGQQAVGFIDTFLINWYWTAIFVVCVIIFITIYSLIMKSLGKKLEEKKKQEKEERREQKQKTVEAINDIRLKGEGIR